MKLIQKIRECATGKRTLIFFVITQIIYGAMLMVTIPHVLVYSQGMKLLDLIPTGYSSEYVRQLLEALGETGRHVYLWQQLPLDMIYPGLFAISYSLLAAFFLNKLSIVGWFQYFCLVPFLGGALDYLENIGTITMLNQYPTFSPQIASVTSIFSILKSITSTVVFVGIIVLLIWLIVKKLSPQRSSYL